MTRHIDKAWTPRHTKAQLNAAAVQAASGDKESATLLAEMMRPYVIKMTRTYARMGDYSWEQKDEIKQSIWVGVWVAAGKFDIKQDVKFNTYAHYWMRHEAQDWMAKNSRALPLSRRQWAVSLRLEEAWHKINPERDIFDATDAELSTLIITDVDDSSKERSIPQAGDIIRAKRSSRQFDSEFDSMGESPSAEDAYFEETDDMEEDALNTVDAMMSADTPDAAYSMALDFIDRHGLPTTVADNMMEAK